MNPSRRAPLHHPLAQTFGRAVDSLTAAVAPDSVRIYRGTAELPDQQYVNLRNMIATALTGNGGFGNATDRQKQEMYEVLVAATGFTQFAYEQALQTNKDELAKQYQQIAGSNLQALTKVSPDAINLTSDGLSVSGGE